MNFANRTIWTADNMEILPGIDSECVDLIYLDPPFNSNKDYAAPIGSKAAGAAFKDTWTLSDLDVAAMGRLADAHPSVYAVVETAGQVHGKGMMSYLVMMADRLVELHRILKPTGSIYLHCDPTANSFLRLLLDAVFGSVNFKNEIVWRRTSSHNRAKIWAPIHDTLLFYTKSNRYPWQRVYQQYDQEYLDKFFRYKDTHGRFRVGDLTGPGTRQGSSGQPWRGIDPTEKGRHWEVPPDRILPPHFEHPNGYPTMTVQQRLDALDDAGLIYWPRRGKIPQRKQYLSVSPGVPLRDIIWDIPPLSAQSKERLGYPTQKPIALLERIIEVSSKEGDVVFDPFCGCATACIAAEKLGRRWAGIDISPKAVELVRHRMAQTNLDISGRTLSVHTTAPVRSDGTKMPRRQIKHTLYGQQEGNCNGCGEHFAFHMLEVDHVWPRSKGGSDTLENSQLLCRHCNSLKSTGTMDDLAVKLTAWQRGGR